MKVSTCLMVLGLVASAPACLASTVSMNLTALGNGTTYGGVYVDPYTISINGVSATLLSCDDFSTEIAVGQTWTANTENAAAVDGAVKFSSGPFSAGGSEQTTYSAAAWIATQLVTPAITNNANTQIDYSLALWELFNPTLSGGPAFSGSLNGPDAGVPSVFTLAFNAVAGGYTGSNVTVYTPNPLGASQEFLEVSAVPVPASLPLLLSGLMGLGAVLRRRRTSAS